MKIPIFASQFRKDMKKFCIGSILLAFLLAGVLPTGCKKPDETDDTPYLSGSMAFDVPFYARQGEKITIKPHGVSHPEGGKLKVYAYGESPVKVALPDTVFVAKGRIERGDLSFTFTMPDSLAPLRSVLPSSEAGSIPTTPPSWTTGRRTGPGKGPTTTPRSATSTGSAAISLTRVPESRTSAARSCPMSWAATIPTRRP